MTEVRFGTTCAIPGDDSASVEMARRVEGCGYDSIWIPDFLTLNHMDPFVLATSIAGATSTLRIGTSVVVVPLRTPLQLAKMATSVDLASNGRFTLGVGIGSFERDFEAAGVSWKNRAKIADEALAATRMLLSGESASYEGQFYRFDNLKAEPQSVQRPLPILAGADGSNGIVEGVVRRAANHCDGIIPFSTSAETFRVARARIIETAAEFGREAGGFTWSNCLFVCFGTDPLDAAHRAEDALSKRFGVPWSVSPDDGGYLLGRPSDVVAGIEQQLDSGVTEIVISPACPPNEMATVQKTFAEQVITAFG